MYSGVLAGDEYAANAAKQDIVRDCLSRPLCTDPAPFFGNCDSIVDGHATSVAWDFILCVLGDYCEIVARFFRNHESCSVVMASSSTESC